MAGDKTLLSYLVGSQLLDQLQHHRWGQLVGQSGDNNSWSRFWSAYLAALLLGIDHFIVVNLGITTKIVAYHGGI